MPRTRGTAQRSVRSGAGSTPCRAHDPPPPLRSTDQVGGRRSARRSNGRWEMIRFAFAGREPGMSSLCHPHSALRI
jgi:hypothetical protein